MKGTASRAVVLLAGLVCGFAGGSFVQAQDRVLKKINWGVTSLSASNWIPWVAKEAKIYEKNGLDVQLILVKRYLMILQRLYLLHINHTKSV